jgi:thiamine-monophosphate kinase
LDLGDAAQQYCSRRLHYPTPRTVQGIHLHGIASAMIDISDGLVADLGHMLEAGGVGATIQLSALPLSSAYQEHTRQVGWDPALSNGDDYELCFTVSEKDIDWLMQVASGWDCGVTEVGVIEKENGLRIVEPAGSAYAIHQSGYSHFKK